MVWVEIARATGLIGVILTLVAYFLLQIKVFPSEGMAYSLMNAIGSVGILVSLYYEWNPAAAIMEFCWLLISLLGVAKAYVVKRHL